MGSQLWLSVWDRIWQFRLLRGTRTTAISEQISRNVCGGKYDDIRPSRRVGDLLEGAAMTVFMYLVRTQGKEEEARVG